MGTQRMLVVSLVIAMAACGSPDNAVNLDASVGDASVGPDAGGTCGDGIADVGEQCDDANTLPGDGCSATCTIESCGDAVLDPPIEECDDGGTANGDGCDSGCQFELVGQTCGDTTVDSGERCDDSNRINGDGCNPTCNFLTKVTQLATGIAVPGSVVTSDGTYLYAYGVGGNCQIHRAAIAQCVPGNCAFTVIAGAGCSGTPPGQQDGPGATALIGGGGGGLTFGVGKLFFSDSHTVRAVDLSSATFDVTTVAGDPNRCGELDGVGSMAVMSDVRGLSFYNGLLYFVDANMATLRQIDPTTGQVTTVAGQTPNANTAANYSCTTNLCCGSSATPADGQGTAGIMQSPRYLTGDNSGSLYIIDNLGRAIRRYDTATGYLSTIISGLGYVDGVGAAVRMDRPRGITSDGTSLYFGEQNENTIRQVEIATQTTSTFVGVRGCPGPRNLMGGSGGDGTQSWAGTCTTAAAVMTKPQFTVGGANSMTFDYGTKSIYAIANGTLLRIE